MRATPAVGLAMILGAALLGAVLAVAMYQVEVSNRARLASAAAPPTSRAAAPTAPPAAAPAATPSAEAATAAGATGDDVAAGEQLFAANCNACHPNANAGIGPALRGPQFAANYPDDASLEEIIRRGSDGMPPYPPTILSDVDLEAMVAYLRSLE